MRFVSPRTTEELVRQASLITDQTRYLAGGTDMLVQLRSGIHEPDCVFDLKGIPELGRITEDQGGWRIGAAVSSSNICDHEGVCSDWPGVAEAMGLIGSTQIQERATMAGNLCNASPAADSVPALIAACAEVRIAGPQGMREVAARDIPIGPGRTSLARGEFVTSILLPKQESDGADAYLRFIPRTEMDIAVAGCGVWMRVDGEKIHDTRVALGAVGPTVIEVEEAGELLVGKALGSEQLALLQGACSEASRPISDKRGTAEFRRRVVGVLAARAAQSAYERARKRQSK